MNKTIKKLLLALATAALGMMSSGAMATNYDFTYSDEGDLTTFVLTSPGGTSIPFDFASTTAGTVINYYPIDGVYGYGNQVGLGSNPNYAYVDFIASIDIGGVVYARFTANNTLNATTGGSGGYVTYLSLSDALTNTNSYDARSFDSATIVQEPSGVAPEMNASMIPQVALMLACLFFLFGRKKENTEVMLAA